MFTCIYLNVIVYLSYICHPYLNLLHPNKNLWTVGDIRTFNLWAAESIHHLSFYKLIFCFCFQLLSPPQASIKLISSLFITNSVINADLHVWRVMCATISAVSQISCLFRPENSPSQDPSFTVMSSNWLLLSDQQSKNQRHWVYYDITKGNAANPHTREAGIREYFQLWVRIENNLGVASLWKVFYFKDCLTTYLRRRLQTKG